MENYTDEEIREVEDSLLGSLMVDSRLVPKVVDALGRDEKAFRTLDNQTIYSAILMSYHQNKKTDPLLVWSVLEKENTTAELNRIGGSWMVLYDMFTKIVETEIESVLYYVSIIKVAWTTRQDKERVNRISQAKWWEDIRQAILDEADEIRRLRSDPEFESRQTLPFPKTLATGIFKDYIDAYAGASEVSPAFLFGTLKTVVGASLGRRVRLEGTTQIFPNFYTCVVGDTALSRKSTAISCAENLINQADPGVFLLRSLSTPEGLIAALVPPEGYEFGDTSQSFEDEIKPPETPLIFDGDQSQFETMIMEAERGVEGFRVCLSIDEFSHMLKKAGKLHGAGLIQLLATAYNFPPSLHLPTRVSPLSADHPCLTLIAASTLQWLESSLKLEDIQGGFANRITYYLDDGKSKPLFRAAPGDPTKLMNIAKSINALRRQFSQPTTFAFDYKVKDLGQSWYIEHRKKLASEKNPLVLMASARTDVHVKKAALLFSAIFNEPDDFEIHVPAFDWAVLLAEYLQSVVEKIYAQFNFSDERRLETRIMEMLEGQPHMTARELTRRISWASAKEVNAACRELVDNGSLAEEATKRTCRFRLVGDFG